MEVVKLITHDNGEPTGDKTWHYIHEISGGQATLCGGEYFGYGESGCDYRLKEGKITCPDCIAIIKEFKSVKL